MFDVLKFYRRTFFSLSGVRERLFCFLCVLVRNDMISVQCWQDEDIKCGFYQSYVRHSFIFGILLLYFLFQTSYEVVNFLYFSKKTTIDLSIKFHVVCPAASVCQLEVNWNISFATWKRKIFSGAVTPCYLLPGQTADLQWRRKLKSQCCSWVWMRMTSWRWESWGGCSRGGP